MGQKTTLLKDGLIILVFLVVAGPAAANYWQVGTGNWSNDDNWHDGEPTYDEQAVINNGGTAQITEIGEECSRLTLGAGDASSGNVEMSSGDFTVSYLFPMEHIGDRGRGTFTQTGGLHRILTTLGYLSLGHESPGEGTYNLSGAGELFAPNENIGFFGTGTFNHSGGINMITWYLNIGTYSGSDGTYNLSGTGELSVLRDEYIGKSGTGAFIQSGGTNTVEETLYLAREAGSVGTYVLSGGMLSAGTIEFGAGAGTFNFNAGRLSVGTFKGNLYNYGGTLAPGSSRGPYPRITSIQGNYEQQSTGVLEIKLGGTNPGTHYDMLGVTGALTLNGTLDVVLINGFNPQVGNQFIILDFNPAQFTGGFSTINLPALPEGLGWDTTRLYTYGMGEIRVQSTTLTLTLLSPNGGETLIMGSTYSITWEGSGPISDVTIEYSTNNGSTWTQVDPPNTGNSGSYDWLVPAVASNQCLVRVSSGPFFDTSDAVFTIRGPELPCGLVSKWPGDGDADDIVGGNHGTLMNGATFAPGKVGQAFSLDGVGDYVQIPYDPSFNLSSFTLQAWVKFTQDTTARIISRPSGGNQEDGFSFFNLENADGKISGGVQGEEQSYSSSVSTDPNTFNDGGWHMCTFVRDVDAGVNGEISIYVDGVSNWSFSDSSPGDMEHNPNGINIGSYDGSQGFFEGLIDEVAIYNCALNADEIWDIFLASAGEGNTPLGSGVVVEPVDPGTGTQPVTVTFSEVTTAGTTTLTVNDEGPPPPIEFQLYLGLYYEITTTATYPSDCTITICINYDDSGLTPAQEINLQLKQYDETTDEWVNITTSLDVLNNIICGVTDHLSFFGLMCQLPATVDIKPETLNPKSKGVFTAFIDLPEGYDEQDIDISTVECEGAPALNGMMANDGRLIVKFDREDLKDVPTGDAVEMTVTGKLTDGRRFIGSDTIRVIDQGKAKAKGKK